MHSDWKVESPRHALSHEFTRIDHLIRGTSLDHGPFLQEVTARSPSDERSENKDPQEDLWAAAAVAHPECHIIFKEIQDLLNSET